MGRDKTGTRPYNEAQDTGRQTNKTQDNKTKQTYKTKKMRRRRPYNNPRVNVLTKMK